jgi:hypothetical protein
MFVWTTERIAGQKFTEDAEGFSVIGIRNRLADPVDAGTADLASRIARDAGVASVAPALWKQRRPHWITFTSGGRAATNATASAPDAFPFGTGGAPIWDPRQPAWRAAARLLARMLEADWQPETDAIPSVARLATRTGLWPTMIEGRLAIVDMLEGSRPVWTAPIRLAGAEGVVAQHAVAKDEWAAQWEGEDR